MPAAYTRATPESKPWFMGRANLLLTTFTGDIHESVLHPYSARRRLQPLGREPRVGSIVAKRQNQTGQLSQIQHNQRLAIDGVQRRL